MNGPLVVIGDTLLDRDVDGEVSRLAPDAPVPVVDESSDRTRAGGAGLAALLSARDGRETILVTALGADDAGAEARGILTGAGVEVIDLGTTAATPEKIRILANGRALVRLDRGGSGKGRIGRTPPETARLIEGAGAVAVSDYGRGITEDSSVREAMARAASRVPMVWDPHPRGASPVPGTTLATPNLGEAQGATPELVGEAIGVIEERGKKLIERWSVAGVAITMGPKGALYVDGSAHPLVVSAPSVSSSDACGAGDRFVVSVAAGLGEALLPSEAVTRAVYEASSFVAMGGAGSVEGEGRRDESGHQNGTDAERLATQVREGGGTVVATGGCFDLVHPGHIAMLEAARRLGDCLIVCLNSDRSVSRLKGPGRPVNGCDARAAVLRGLASVDGVEVFDGDTPHEALRRIKPHIWVKGGDYGSTPLPESELVRSWGGEVVILPYLRGYSTSGIIERAGLGEQ